MLKPTPKTTRRSFALGLACAGVATLSAPHLATAQTMAPRFALHHNVVEVQRVSTAQPVVAMTFDDGPHPSLTPPLLDMLKRRNLRVTFYVVGYMARAYPDVLRRAVDEGHEIGNHTFRHPYLSRLSDARVLEEIDRTSDLVWRLTGQVPSTLRPPYGAITARQMRMIHQRRNLASVMWSVDPLDWRRPGPSVVTRRILNGAHRGAVILAHDIHAPTIRAMPATFDGLLDRGYRFRTMSELLGWGTWGSGAQMASALPDSVLPPLQ